MSYPFILSEHHPFRPPQKTGAMIQKSVTEHMIRLALTTTRKALSQQISLSVFLATGMNILTTPATQWNPDHGFLNTWIHWPVIRLAPWPLLLVLAMQSTDLLCVRVAPHFINEPCLVLNDLAHSPPWKFLSLHQSLGHDSMKGWFTVSSSTVYYFPIFLKPSTKRSVVKTVQ